MVVRAEETSAEPSAALDCAAASVSAASPASPASAVIHHCATAASDPEATTQVSWREGTRQRRRTSTRGLDEKKCLSTKRNRETLLPPTPLGDAPLSRESDEPLSLTDEQPATAMLPAVDVAEPLAMPSPLFGSVSRSTCCLKYSPYRSEFASSVRRRRRPTQFTAATPT